MRMKNKKGQEEIVGFVLIMVIVSVVFLIFLGISLRTGSNGIRSESSEIYQFLESSMEYTSSCSYSSTPDYFSLGELFEECYSGNNCLNEKNSCDVLNTTLVEIFESSWNIDPEGEGVVEGYEFVSMYVADSSAEGEEIISLKEGDCNGPIKGASYLSPAFPGKIESSLKICF